MVVDGFAGLDHPLIHQVVKAVIEVVELLGLEGGFEQELDAVVAEAG